MTAGLDNRALACAHARARNEDRACHPPSFLAEGGVEARTLKPMYAVQGTTVAERRAAAHEKGQDRRLQPAAHLHKELRFDEGEDEDGRHDHDRPWRILDNQLTGHAARDLYGQVTRQPAAAMARPGPGRQELDGSRPA